jgi:hypothetical protein
VLQKKKTLNTKHEKLNSDVEIVVREEFTYDAQDRLAFHVHQINGGTKQLLQKNTYNELGQLKMKNVGGLILAVITVCKM